MNGRCEAPAFSWNIGPFKFNLDRPFSHPLLGTIISSVELCLRVCITSHLKTRGLNRLKIFYWETDSNFHHDVLAHFEFVLKLKLYSICFLPNDHLIGIWGDFEVIGNQKRQSDIVSNCRFAFWENKLFKMWVAWLSLYFSKFRRIQEVCFYINSFLFALFLQKRPWGIRISSLLMTCWKVSGENWPISKT